MDYAALKNEIDTDPKGLGLSFVGKTDKENAGLLNDIGLSNEQLSNNNITADDIYAAVDMTEMATATQNQKDRIDQLLLMGVIRPVKSAENIRITIASEFATMPKTRDAFLVLTYRDVGRAEALFGQSVSLMDVHMARRL